MAISYASYDRHVENVTQDQENFAYDNTSCSNHLPNLKLSSFAGNPLDT